MSDLTRASARARIWPDRRWEAAAYAVLRCRAPVGANLVSKGKTLPYCSIFVRIPSEMAVLPEAHQQMSDLTHAFSKGANLARWALECCEAGARDT